MTKELFLLALLDAYTTHSHWMTKVDNFLDSIIAEVEILWLAALVFMAGFWFGMILSM